jgi:hypothetical protein
MNQKSTTTDDWNGESKAVRQLYLVIRAVLKTHPDEDAGEIAALVKDRLRDLKIPWTPLQLHDALATIDRRPEPRVPQRPRENEMAQQVDPPWRAIRRGPSQWTSLRDLMARFTKRPSDPST